MCGISHLKKQATKVTEAALMAKEIKKKNLALAKVEEKTFLYSCGVHPSEILTSTSGSEANSDSSEDTEVSLDIVSVSESESEVTNVKTVEDGDMIGRGSSAAEMDEVHDMHAQNPRRDSGVSSNLKDRP